MRNSSMNRNNQYEEVIRTRDSSKEDENGLYH